MIVAMDRSFDFEPFKQCGDAMYRIRMHLRNIEELRGSAVALREYFRKSSERYGIECHPSPGYMKPMENKIDYMLSESAHGNREKSCYYANNPLIKSQLSTSIGIRNASYMRENTIELRRIAQQNQVDARESKLQAEIAQKDSRSMTKISYMTMIYLPANFIAVSLSQCPDGSTSS
jgi:hypothetical protein